MFPNRAEVIVKLARRLAGDGRELSFCYEAGPCGYGLQRQIEGLGHACVVAAPSLIPSKPGDRVKTDRRDALSLAKLHRAGELTAVWVPDGAHEAMRDLVRARAAAVRVLGKARQHLQGFLLRHGRVGYVNESWPTLLTNVGPLAVSLGLPLGGASGAKPVGRAEDGPPSGARFTSGFDGRRGSF